MSQGFTIISALVVDVLLLVMLRRFASRSDWRTGLIGLTAIAAATAVLGKSGILGDFSQVPPPMGFVLVGLFVVAAAATLSRWGKRVSDAVPLRWLIGAQGFRILPETLLALAWQDGLAPVQMTFHGRNGDLISAILALVLAFLWPRIERARKTKVAAWTFTIIGGVLLANILSIAVLSMPTPFRVFTDEPANIFVATFPYIWLPGVHVFAALILHALTVRKLVEK